MAPLVFFGTPELAIPTLAALVEAGRAPVCVVTQPARPVDRGQQPREPPVARWARAHSLAILQPARVRSPEFLAELRPLALAVAVVVAFGQIFPAELLSLPAHGCLNLHASLLPRYRGAAPIQAAIAAGETRTGVTIMRMEQGLDSGPVLLQEETPIGALETAGDLGQRLAAIGARLMLEALARLERGGLAARAQDDTLANYAAAPDARQWTGGLVAAGAGAGQPAARLHSLARAHRRVARRAGQAPARRAAGTRGGDDRRR